VRSKHTSISANTYRTYIVTTDTQGRRASLFNPPAMAARGLVSYWVRPVSNPQSPPTPSLTLPPSQWLPILSGFIWLGMLLGLLLYWIVGTHSRRYPAIPESQSLAYISHIGAYEMKPLFIAGCVLTTVTLDASFLAERWLRHRGRLVPNQTLTEKVLFGLSIFFATVGTVGLICLSVYDTVDHPTLHNLFLMLFIGGYLLSAVFICWEYQRLGISAAPSLESHANPALCANSEKENRAYRVLRISFWIKLAFVLTELALAVTFLATTTTHHRTVAAYFEWIISFIFTAYVWSFAIDLWPAIKTKSYSKRFSKANSPREMEENSDESLPTAPPLVRGTAANF
jgi:hypothetical protein